MTHAAKLIRRFLREKPWLVKEVDRSEKDDPWLSPQALSEFLPWLIARRHLVVFDETGTSPLILDRLELIRFRSSRFEDEDFGGG